MRGHASGLFYYFNEEMLDSALMQNKIILIFLRIKYIGTGKLTRRYKMFKSAVVYKMSEDFSVSLEALEKQLPQFTFSPCSGQDLKKSGWVPALEKSDVLCYTAKGQILLTILTEDKILPASVIKEFLDEKVARIEEMEGKKVKKADKDRLKDEVIQDLLPRAFSKYNKTFIWIDNEKKNIVVDSGSAKKAEDALALLRKTLGSLPVTPLTTETPIELTLTAWIKDQEIPEGFSVLDEAELKAVLEDGGVLTSKKEDLFSDEIKQHIEAGKMVTKLSIGWRDRLTFTLSDDGLLKKVKLSDGVIEEGSQDIDKDDEAQKFDGDFILITENLRALLTEMESVFGVLGNDSGEDGSEKEESEEE